MEKAYRSAHEMSNDVRRTKSICCGWSRTARRSPARPSCASVARDHRARALPTPSWTAPTSTRSAVKRCSTAIATEASGWSARSLPPPVHRRSDEPSASRSCPRTGDAGFDLVYVGHFGDQGFYDTQQEVNDRTWMFPGALAEASMVRVAEAASDADANGGDRDVELPAGRRTFPTRRVVGARPRRRDRDADRLVRLRAVLGDPAHARCGPDRSPRLLSQLQPSPERHASS